MAIYPRVQDQARTVDGSNTYAQLGRAANVQSLVQPNLVGAANSTAAMTAIRVALANRHYSRFNVVCVGDSITEGQGATALTRRWVARLADMLRARFPTIGVTGGGRGYLGATFTGENSFTQPATVTGGSTHDGFGAKKRGTVISTGNTISYSLTGTSADIQYVTGGSLGSFTWQVDGGGATTISTAQGSSVVDGVMSRVSLGSAGTHTLLLTGTTAAQSFIGGVVEYNGDENAGIQVHDCGHFGYATHDWNTSDGSMASPRVPAAWAAFSPSVIIITLGTNDFGTSRTPAQFLADLQAVIADIRAAGMTAVPIVLNVWVPSASGTVATWLPYVTQMYAAAAADSSALTVVCDLNTRMPPITSNGALSFNLYDGNVHPVDKGHALVADILTEFLGTA